MAQTPVELIEALCMADAISGREEKVRELLIQKIDGHCEWRVDARGNLLCHKKGKKPAQKRVMITAHMDEAGFMLTGIREDGLLRFANVGEIDSRVVLGKAVRIDGEVIGVIGTKPIHLQTREEQDRPMPLDQLYIDIGASTKTSAEQAVKLGAQVTFAGEGVAAFGNGYLTGKAMETRAACAMLAQLLCEDWEKDVDVVFTTSAQAMTSGGANAAFALHPDVAIVIGSIAAHDGKGGKGTCKLGKGPATCLHDLTTYYDLDTYNQCIQIAEEKGLPLQQLELHGIAEQRVVVEVVQADHPVQTAEFQVQQQTLALQRILGVYRRRHRLDDAGVPVRGDGAGPAQLHVPLIRQLPAQGHPPVRAEGLRQVF